MSPRATAADAAGTPAEVLALRYGVLLPAALVVLALGVNALRQTEDAAPATEATELRPPGVVRALPPVHFGPPLPEVLSASDAVQTAGGWALLDRRAQQLVFLDANGGLVARAGRQGFGPGELSRATHIAVVDSLLVVVEGTGEAFHLFREDGTFLGRVPLDSPGCRMAPVQRALGGRGGVVLLRACTRGDGTVTARVETFDLAGGREHVADRVYNDLATGRLDPSRLPLLARAGGRLLLGITPERCVTVLGPQDEPALCHPAADPVPLPDSALAIFRELAPRVSAFGATMDLPVHYPPFDRILEIGGELAFRIVLGDERRALDLVRGGELERILLPDRVSVFAGSRGILLARDHLEGTAFAVAGLP